MNLNPFAKAFAAGAAAALSTLGAAVTAHSPVPLTVEATIVAFAGALIVTWAVAPTIVKAIFAGIVNAGGAFAATYGQASGFQIWVSVILGFLAGSGLVAAVQNFPAVKVINGRSYQ